MTNREKTSVGEKHVPGLRGGEQKPCFRENFIFMEPGELKSSLLAVPQSHGQAQKCRAEHKPRIFSRDTELFQTGQTQRRTDLR